MPNTSSTYNFQTIEVEVLIREAFERIGILGEMVEAQKLDSARRSINFMLLEWMNKSVNLWTLQSSYLALITNQGQYTLPNIIADIIQVNLRTSSRQLNGNPQTNTAATYDNGGGGNAAFAFDGDPTTSCVQNVADGNISYDYGVGIAQQINFVGITSENTQDLTIVVESSDDTATWVTLLEIPTQTFLAGINLWFDIPTPITTRAYRIRGIGGQTLNIQEIYFNNNVLDMPISNVSRYEYFTYPNKKLSGRTNVYYLDSQINPILNLWPVPSNQYNCLQYTYKKMMQDVGLYTNSIQIPQRFYQALVWGLSYYMAVKFNPQISGMLLSEYDKAFNLASLEDSEITPIRIYADYNEGNYL